MKVFISYKSEERPQIAELENVLIQLGFDVWFDKNLVGGQSWWDQILFQIRDADVVILALSDRSIRSLACQRERDYAFALKKHVIPIVISADFNFNLLPHQMSALQMIHFHNSHDVTTILTLARAFIALPEVGPMPDPLPSPPPIPMVDVSRLIDLITNEGDLSLEDQDMLFKQLTQIMEDSGDSQVKKDALTGLMTLRNHTQLWNNIADRIDNLLITLPPDQREGATISHANIRVDTQRREVTALLARIASFTTFSEHLEPEVIFSIYNRYTNLVDDSIRDFKGVVDNFAGNRVMGLFNTQLNPQEDHVTRAVNAALQMQLDLHSLHSEISDGFRFHFAISIHTGTVTLGNVRTSNRDKLSVIGDTINIIQEVQNSASPGDILVTKSVYDVISDAYDCELFERVRIKDQGNPQQIYRVIKRKPSPSNSMLLDAELRTLLDDVEDNN